MGKAVVNISAEDHASSVIDNVAKRLGIFSQQGIAMGIGFAALTKGIQFAEQAISAMIDYIAKGIEMNREFELSMARLSVSIVDFDMSIENLSTDLKYMSVMFGTDLNTLTLALRNFTREGFSASEATKMLFQTEKFAIATNEDLTSAQHSVIETMETFGLGSESTNYIIEKLNQIISKTGLTLADISRIMGQSSTVVQESGINFETFANILYTLDDKGVGTRRMFTELEDTIKNLNSTTLKILGVVDDVSTKFETITATTAFTKLSLDKLAELKEMDLSKPFDISTYFDKEKWDNAVETVRLLKTEGITTLEQFNALMASSKGPVSIGGEKLVQEGLDITKLIRIILAYNDWTGQATDSTQALKDEITKLGKETDIYIATLETTNIAIETNKDNIADWIKEQEKLTTLHGLNEDIRYMGMGLEDASYAEKIHNVATKELIDSIRVQREEIDALNEANSRYSLESNKNNLAIMKIQYEADGQRRGLTRGQQRMIKDLQHADMGLRISMTENQLAIDQKTLDLSPEEKRLNQLSMWYNEEIYLRQDAYKTEMIALDEKIKLEYDKMQMNYNNVTMWNNKLIQSDLDAYAARVKVWEQEHGQSWGQVGVAPPGVPAPPGYTQSYLITPPEVYNRSPLPKLQMGGYIPETAPYLLHRGETVIPANKNTSNNNTINIVNHVNVNNSGEIDTNKLCSAIATATREGILKTNISRYGAR